jgi:hypothetical protein
MRVQQSHALVPEVVVTGSPQFRRETLDASDLTKFSGISLAETQRRAVYTRLLEQLAEEVYVSVTSQF